MRVGLDLVYLLPGETGGRESYARELIPAMIAAGEELELVAFVNRDAGPALADELGVERAVVLPVSPRARSQWALAELAHVPLAARRAGVDLVHSLANFAPPWGPFRRVVTVHDLQYRAVPGMLPWHLRAGTSALVSLAARRAHRIIAVSLAGAEEVGAGLGIERARIDVVPNGVRPPAPSPPAQDARERYRLGNRDVVLSVATNLPHKNLRALVAALAQLDPGARPVLIFAGHGTNDGVLASEARATGVGDDVRLLGARSAEELESLYAVADCLVLPSQHEGFGLPVIEAMARSLPVACSDIAALHEVAGDAALYFDPREPAQIAARLEQLLGDAELASRLREQGRLRAQAFSWSAAAAGTLASYRRALAGAA
jgi:glycosyltransferase involved in cell wall biosynthesis